MEKLTRRQQEIMDFILSFMEKEGYPPTRAEIARHFGFRSPNAAESHLRALDRKGAIRLEAGRSRGLTPLVARRNQQALPLVGRVAAGSPVLAVSNVEREVPVDPTLFSPRPDYLLRVKGSSMKNAGIFDGDLIAVHKTPIVRQGGMAVVRIDDEVTVKYLYKYRNRVELLPDNPDFEPIVVYPQDHEIHVEGVAVGVLRTGMVRSE
ncbi:MAG: transcriptional repressor LexA [Xanthomonadales bacterium]|nr:transcriptional repressor LexA [Xanthomonadales bacterium]